MTAATLLTVLAGMVGALALAVYLFGIPPEIKRKLERSALKTMGENKLSYMAKGESSRRPSFLLSSPADQPQTKSPKCLPRTKKTSRTSRKALATL